MTKTGILETVIPGWVLHSKQDFMTSNLFQTDRMCCSNGLGQRLIIGTDKERHRVSFRVNPFQSFGRIILPWTTNTHSPQTPMFWVPDRFVRIKEGRMQSNNVPEQFWIAESTLTTLVERWTDPYRQPQNWYFCLPTQCNWVSVFFFSCSCSQAIRLSADGFATPFTMS